MSSVRREKKFIGLLCIAITTGGARMGRMRIFCDPSITWLNRHGKLDLSILHGDRSNTVAKKGGEGIGYSGHKRQKGEKILTIVDNHGYCVAPVVVRSVNVHDLVLFPNSFDGLLDTAHLLGMDVLGSHITLDSGFDSDTNRELIKSYELIPVIKPNHRGTKDKEKREERDEAFQEVEKIYKEGLSPNAIFADFVFFLFYLKQKKYRNSFKWLFGDSPKERHNVERSYAWEDTYRKLVIRYEKLQCAFLGFRYLAYSMMNFRDVFQGN